MVPVTTSSSIARMPTPCQLIMSTLNNEFRLLKSIVITRVVYIEMRTDEHIDIVRTQAKIGQMLKHIFYILSLWRIRRWRVVRRKPAIDENILPIAHLHQIAPRDHFQRSACNW